MSFNEKNPDKTKGSAKAKEYARHLLWPGILLGVCTAVYYFVWIWNPLPSDEAMITNFKEHRADFVEAVRRYREYPRPNDKDTSLWFKEGDTLEVYRRAGISRIESWTPVWLPDPYSPENYKKIDEEIKAHRGFALAHKYGALEIIPATPQPKDNPNWDWANDRAFRRNTLTHGVIWKDYNFFPEPPRIENDRLLGPISHLGTNYFKDRVLPSLNQIPPDWKSFECVFRQIEPQWYLRLCNGH